MQPNSNRNHSYKQRLLQKYHLIFNQIKLHALQTMEKEDLIPLPEVLKERRAKPTCSGCAHGKRKLQPYKPTSHAHRMGAALCSDVMGPVPQAVNTGNKYVAPFMDVASRYVLCHFIPNRRHVNKYVRDTLALVHNWHKRYHKTFTTENAREYFSKYLLQLDDQAGTTVNPTISHTPQQNSLAERIFSTLMGSARATLHQTQVSENYWEYAMRDAVFKYNITRLSTASQLPQTKWRGKAPPIQLLYAVGQISTAYAHRDRNRVRKLNSRAFPARYLYAATTATIGVQELQKGKIQRIRAINFQPYP
eukprot:GFKZ01001312.1.p1 GENE.GFKZ01001312.1~~GFKZ01001312.1.p1  ORF type:complete len:306 (+),score=11.41 GFKZ01001312.1:1491-2408(+)